MAASPQLIDAFLKLTAIFDGSALEPVAREVVIMTVATRNGCHICVAMHTARLVELRASPDLVTAMRDAEPLPDEHLEAIRVFTCGYSTPRATSATRPCGDFLTPRVHGPERARGRARNRDLHHVHPGQPADRCAGR